MFVSFFVPAFTKELSLIFVVVHFLSMLSSFVYTDDEYRYTGLDWTGFNISFEFWNLDSPTGALNSDTGCGPGERTSF
jgi:hypothetical protein